ncbi:cytochrome P450 [Crossiella equi]|uniref:Cytochrome P450 n=1 Tax=Crossiella equi TaxID=130796 RepID=A0ABS5AN67_9PSEU|nr:cytochrome P450 [Crossiella equi]MBP2477861.1 cytochrome P450 [Crossiella equi]
MPRQPDPADADLFDADFARDPYPSYARVRAVSPVRYLTLPTGLTAWLVTGYAEVRQALTDPALSKESRHDAEAGANLSPTMGPSMLFLDPPDHERLRKLVSGAFTRRRVEALHEKLHDSADRLIDTFAARGHADLMREFALRLPVGMIGELLGVPEHDRDTFFDLAHDYVGFTPETRDRAVAALGGLTAYMGELVEAKKADPGEDLVSALVRARDGQGALTDEELRANTLLLFLAGHVTTAGLISNATLALLRNPEQRKAFLADPGLADNLVEEALRYEGPAELSTMRWAKQDTEIGGVAVARGERVLVSLGAANRDPRRFTDPDVFDLARPDAAQHLGLGHGIHYCLGAQLARVEVRLALVRLFDRLPDLGLAVPYEDLEWMPGIGRSPMALPVAFTPAEVAA